MNDRELKIKIDNQIKRLVEKIDSNVSKEQIKEDQMILNKLLEEYLNDRKYF